MSIIPTYRQEPDDYSTEGEGVGIRDVSILCIVAEGKTSKTSRARQRLDQLPSYYSEVL
jgi:hypothetical protein